jgi:signal peptidase I
VGSSRFPASPYRALASIAVAFVGAFLFLRTMLVEPFGVPTGSMAPTLLGHHREAPCPRCGAPVRVGTQAIGFADIPCPNCGRRVDLSDAPEVGGDRLLADKNVYNLRPPRRWEVAVFRCPADLSKPFVKRVVGLPGEEITIRDGDVYADGQLLRKTLAQTRETRVPVFDMAHVPDPGGWGVRWLVYPPESDPRLPKDAARPPAPAGDSIVRGGTIVLDAASGPDVRLEYRHWQLDDRREEPVRSQNSYDGPGRGESNVYPVHDFVLSCDIEVVSAGPDGRFACRLFDGADAVAAEVAVGPRASGQAHLSHDRRGGLGSVGGVAFEPGRTHALEFAFVDRRVTLALDGRVVLGPVDLPAEPKRGEVSRPLQLGAAGCHLVVHNLKLDRDIHYTRAGRHGTRVPARLGPGEYFLLGDNSGNSQDSREWPEPGVPRNHFIGKPILVHQPLRAARTGLGGRDRVVQTIDWSRLRWLR